MLVKHNLLLNNDKLTMPDMIEGTGEAELINGTLYLYNFSQRIGRMTINKYDEQLSELVKEDDRFYVGLYGKFDTPFKLYKGESYKSPYKKGDFYYIEAGAKNIFTTFLLNFWGFLPTTIEATIIATQISNINKNKPIIGNTSCLYNLFSSSKLKR